MLKGRIQYITHPQENFDDLSWVHRLHDNGIDWIQLRIKEQDLLRWKPDEHYLAYFHEVAFRMRAITEALGMMLTINDLQDVCFFSNAGGLHVGQEDTWPDFAAHSDLIIGGTAHSVEEILRFPAGSMSYFGVGPLRGTETKADTKAPLGLEGYRNLIDQLNSAGIATPVFAIGGITPADVKPLLETGVYGIAVSGAIFNEKHSPGSVRAFAENIQVYEAENR